MSILWSKKQIATVIAILWWLIKEFATDSAMQGIRDYLSKWSPAVAVWDFLSAHPAVITLLVFSGVTCWAYWEVRKQKGKIGQQIAVKPVVGKRQADYERTEHLMWAELQITNSSPKELKDVQVNINSCLTLQVRQDSVSRNDYLMWDSLELKPFSIYWSQRQTQAQQMKLDIPKDATRSALVALQNNSNGGQFVFNSLNHEWIVGGAKIDIELTDAQSVLWRGSFYIECRPNYVGKTALDYDRARFEFIEWDKWAKARNITLLEFGTEDSQTQ